MEMDDAINELADDYEKSQKAGQEYIRKVWRFLKEGTKTYLITSSCYDQRGQRLEVEFGVADDIDTLESYLGSLNRCAECNLPSRTVENSTIQREAFSEDVLAACDEFLYRHQWHDPHFLRLALRALRIHKLANLMTRLPAIKEEKHWIFLVKAISLMIYGILGFLLMLASPYFIGVALTSAAKGDEGGAVFALYFVGLAIFIFAHQKNFAKDIGKPTSEDEVEYSEWYRLNPYAVGSWLSTGAGAKFYFQEMARKGVNVPPVAIDLCAVLEASVLKKP